MTETVTVESHLDGELSPIGAELAVLIPALAEGPHRHPVKRTKRTATREPIPHSDRVFVYTRDDFQCVWCAKTSNLTLDHITPWSALGSDHVDNLRTLCWDCNERRSNFQHIDDNWRPLPMTFWCEHCNGGKFDIPQIPLDHPSVTRCFCWWCKRAGLGSRSAWFEENPDYFWDYDLNWTRRKPPGFTAQLWEAWIASKRHPLLYDPVEVPWEYLNLDLTNIDLMEHPHLPPVAEETESA